MRPEPWTPWFIADWNEALFVHFLVEADKLQELVPLELDLWEADAVISLVAFTQSRLRPIALGRLGELLSAPLAQHEFLNLRTYVRSGEKRGIYFLAEWIPNRLAALIGPRVYGLPYRLAKLCYQTDLAAGFAARDVRVGARQILLQARMNPSTPPRVAVIGSIEHFLLERYAAWTCIRGVRRCFRISHSPWTYLDAAVQMLRMELLEEFAACLSPGRLVGAQYSRGLRNVLIGPPERQTLPSELCTLE